MNYFDLTDKIALVTGANKGIGKALAEALATAGADIIGVSSSMSLTDSEISTSIQNIGRKFWPYRADFNDRNALYGFINKINQEHPVIDILINNAGTLVRSPIIEHQDEDWDKILNINLNSPFILTREIGKGMLMRGNGKIIFIASILTFQGGLELSSYTASKGALGNLIKALSNEWAAKGINVNGIAPGYTSTDNTKRLRNDAVRYKATIDRIPAGRWAEPEDLKGPVVFLASSASDYVHGTMLTVDGGWMGR